MSDDDVYRTAKCFGDGLQGVEAYGILASLYSADVVALIARHVCEVLLCHALCFAEVSNALTYPLSFFFFAHIIDTLVRNSNAFCTCRMERP